MSRVWKLRDARECCRLAVLVALMLVAYPALGNAATITFNAGSMGPGNAPEIPFDATFTEAGFDVEGFWAAGVGTAAGAYVGGHFHNVNNEEQHFNGADQLQGLLIEAIGDGLFSLNSLDFLVRSNTSINGFNPSQVFVLVSTSFNPQNSVASQFTQIAVSGNGTLAIAGFNNVNKVFISSTASVSFDNIVLNSAAAETVPEPASLLLLGSGVCGFAVRRFRRRSS